MGADLTDVTIQDIYGALVNDIPRNEMIANDIVRALESGRCPLLLTGRTEHLQYFAAKLAGVARHVFVLKGGMGKKQRREITTALAAVPENESRVILATGSYIEERFDDTRLDTRYRLRLAYASFRSRSANFSRNFLTLGATTNAQ
jgi:hypothetical protein